jgi:hypothetical protein
MNMRRHQDADRVKLLSNQEAKWTLQVECACKMVVQNNLKHNGCYDIVMIKAMKGLYWVVKENIALRKWQSLKDLLDYVGVGHLSPLEMAGNAKYNSDTILAELLEALDVVFDLETDTLRDVPN